MNDAYFRDKLSAYLDNELPPDERVMIENYLTANAEARAHLEELKRLKALVDREAELRDDLYWERSARRIEETLGIRETESQNRQPTRRAFGFPRWTAMVASAAAVLLVAYVALKQEDVREKVERHLDNPVGKRSSELTEPSAGESLATLALEQQSGEAENPGSVRETQSRTADVAPKLKDGRDTVSRRETQSAQSIPVPTEVRGSEPVTMSGVRTEPPTRDDVAKEKQKEDIARAPSMKLDTMLKQVQVATSDKKTKNSEERDTSFERIENEIAALSESTESGKSEGATDTAPPGGAGTLASTAKEAVKLVERKSTAKVTFPDSAARTATGFSNLPGGSGGKVTPLDSLLEKLRNWYVFADTTANTNARQRSIDSLLRYAQDDRSQVKERVTEYLRWLDIEVSEE